MTTENTIPPGYWMNARGDLVPESRVTDIDKLRDQVVRDLCVMAKQERDGLREFKVNSMQEVAALITTSLEQYGLKQGGDKGNVTLYSYDGSFKVQRRMADHQVFSEQLMAAKEMVDKCVISWSQGSDDKIKALVMHAFQTDKEGKINIGRVLGLRNLKIDDADWKLAMQALTDSIMVASTKPHIRFFERNASGGYDSINLDLAAV